jgi:hypothetical protein
VLRNNPRCWGNDDLPTQFGHISCGSDVAVFCRALPTPYFVCRESHWEHFYSGKQLVAARDGLDWILATDPALDHDEERQGQRDEEHEVRCFQ